MKQSIIGKGVTVIVEGLVYVAFTALMIMMLIGVWGTIANWIGLSAPGVMEWSEILNVILICLPMTYVTLQRRHIEIDLVTTFLKPRSKRILYIATLFPFLFFSTLIAWRLIPQALESLSTMEKMDISGNMAVWWWPGKLAVAIGFIGMALANLYMLISELFKKTDAK
jgi:TRAP-type C4-dicarboxylate transport system permease small subunit